MPDTTKNKRKKMTSQDLQIEILKFLLTHSRKQFAARQIIDLIGVSNNIDSVEHALNQLTTTGAVKEFPGNKFGVALEKFTVAEDEQGEGVPKPSKSEKPDGKRTSTKRPKRQAQQQMDDWEYVATDVPPTPPPPEPIPLHELSVDKISSKRQKTLEKSPKIVEGRVDMTRSGAAYIVTEALDSDIYVAPKYLNGALHGDWARVMLFAAAPPRRRRGVPPAPRKPEGEIIEVLKRATEFFIGTIRISRKYALVVPDNPNMPIDIFVPLPNIADAKDGDKVVVRITDWQEGKSRSPMGKVTQTFGTPSGNDFEMNKILINAGFELQHSEASMDEAEAIPETISPQEIARRRDFRDILTFTIDPEDARDFDDALSIRELEDGQLEIGVHIADVTHYLKPDTPLDQEAYRRSTSVYLVDRVNPMLPEKLSNNLCSLVPHQDRLTFSAVFVFEKEKLVKRWFGKTVIHSAHRFSYEEAQKVLEEQPSETVQNSPIFDRLQWALANLNRIAKKMRTEREKNGAIGFETEEIRFRLAEDGSPIEAYVKERKDAHMLIEDFMLLANKEVALFIDQKGEGQQEIPFVYRVHDLPDMAKVAEFARFAHELGHPMKVDTPQQIALAYNSLMHAAQKDERLKLLEPLAIRTMAKAVYSANNIGHYGLGFSHYSHFTSPIRRYSDVLAHRLLEQNLDGRTYRMDKSKLEEQCKHISLKERKAADAERESVKYKQAELIQRHIGEIFQGTITGFLDRGFFVELPGSKAEGLVDFRSTDDQYVVAEGKLRAKGRRSGRELKMGDKIRVKVIAVELGRRQIDLELEESE